MMIRNLTTGFWAAVFSGAAAAATAVSVSNVVPDSPINSTTAGLLGTGVAGLVWAALQLRRKMSRDNLDMKADRTAFEMLDRTQKERDDAVKDARLAWASKNADSMELGQLRAENAYLKEQLRATQDMVSTIRRGVLEVGKNVDNVQTRMEKTAQKLTNSGSAPLGKE
jgi:hypothetical protein